MTGSPPLGQWARGGSGISTLQGCEGCCFCSQAGSRGPSLPRCLEWEAVHPEVSAVCPSGSRAHGRVIGTPSCPLPAPHPCRGPRRGPWLAKPPSRCRSGTGDEDVLVPGLPPAVPSVLVCPAHGITRSVAVCPCPLGGTRWPATQGRGLRREAWPWDAVPWTRWSELRPGLGAGSLEAPSPRPLSGRRGVQVAGTAAMLGRVAHSGFLNGPARRGVCPPQARCGCRGM